MNHYEKTKSACEQEWPDSLDAMVAAPEHHEILLENERVRVLDSRIKAGDTVPVHTHRWPSVLFAGEPQPTLGLKIILLAFPG
jgi:hypothetical protein